MHSLKRILQEQHSLAVSATEGGSSQAMSCVTRLASLVQEHDVVDK